MMLENIEVVKNLDWMDERPFCRHLIASWRAGHDTGGRCADYRDGCSMAGGLCAMEDPAWVFLPGWDVYSEWRSQERGYVTLDVWPGWRPGMLAVYTVDGDCMTPTWCDGDNVVARIGGDFADGAACVIQRLVPGWGLPLRGYLFKRLTRIGDDYLLTADSPDFEPCLAPAGTVNVVAVALEAVPPLDQVTTCHVFDDTGRIVPNLRAVARLEG